jgi:hypothetical protein
MPVAEFERRLRANQLMWKWRDPYDIRFNSDLYLRFIQILLLLLIVQSIFTDDAIYNKVEITEPS